MTITRSQPGARGYSAPNGPPPSAAPSAPSARSAISAPAPSQPTPGGQPPTIYDIVTEERRRFAHLEPAKVAHTVLGHIGVTGKARALLLPLVIGVVDALDRRDVLAAERKAFSGPRPAPNGRGVTVIGGYEPDVAKLRGLLNKPLAVGDGTEDLTWGTATVEQLRQRKEMIAKHVRGLSETLARLDFAIALIESRGVNTLAEALEEAA